MHHIAAQTHMNRMGEKRRDREWLDRARASPEARFYMLIDLKLAIRSDADRTNTRLRNSMPARCGQAGLDMAEACFLGVRDDGAPLSSRWRCPADAARLPGGCEGFEPLVDLRTLALRADVPPHRAVARGARPAASPLARDASLLRPLRRPHHRPRRRLAARLLGLRANAFPAIRSGRDHAHHA